MSQIGRYEIVRQTGNHGLGSLYQAFDPVMQRSVMIRIADRSTSSGISFDQARQAILFDAKQLAHLDHPNIIKFLACEEDDGRPYLVMERFDGKPLSGQVAPQKLAPLLKTAALALDHAHSQGLIHRNLTPDSLLIDDDDLKVTGFEIARPAQYLNSDEAGQDFDLLLDSIHYMSPELVRGDGLDSRSDQYSLGVIAWQALTGALPFRADSPITLLSNIAFERPDLAAAVSKPVLKVFTRVFAKDPGERFVSSSEFASAFEMALAEPEAKPVLVVEPPAVAPRPVVRELPEEKKSPLMWIVVGIVVLVAAMVAGILMFRPARTPAPVPAPVVEPVPVVEPPPAVKAKPKAAKKTAPVKEAEPEAPRLKPIEPKVVH